LSSYSHADKTSKKNISMTELCVGSKSLILVKFFTNIFLNPYFKGPTGFALTGTFAFEFKGEV